MAFVVERLQYPGFFALSFESSFEPSTLSGHL